MKPTPRILLVAADAAGNVVKILREITAGGRIIGGGQ